MKKYLMLASLLTAGAFVPTLQRQVYAQPTVPQDITANLNSTFLGLNSSLEYPNYGGTEALEVRFTNDNPFSLYPPGTQWNSNSSGPLYIEPYIVTVVVPAGMAFPATTPAGFPAGWDYTQIAPTTIQLQPNSIIPAFADDPGGAVTVFTIPVELLAPVNNQPYTVMFTTTGLPYRIPSGTTITSGGDITVQGVPLPVSFSGFTAKGDGCAVSLDWTTAIEVNNKLFQVERSANGKTFEAIAEVKGAGNSNQPVKYAFVDKAPLNGHNFYRIRQIDFDGKSKYSAIEQVQVNCYEENIRVYPNPAEQVVYISGLRDQTTVEVYDVSGKRVLVKETQGSTEGLNLSGLASGTYHVRITKGEALLLSTPLVIKK